MSAEPAPLRRLVAVDADTGETVSAEVAMLQQQIEVLKGQVKDLERDLRTKRATITKLRKDQIQERLDYVGREKVEAVLAYYNRRLGRNVALTADRFDAIRGILEETRIVIVDGKPERHPAYEFPADFKRAIDGAWHEAFEKKRKNGTVKRYDDVTLVFRDATRFEEFMARSPFA